MTYSVANAVEWVVEWSNGRITESEAIDFINGYWYFMAKHKRPPHGLFPEAFTRYLLSEPLLSKEG